MQSTVTITKKHTINAMFSSVTDCPLHRALREQHPELGVNLVGGNDFSIADGRNIPFDGAEWGALHFLRLMTGALQEVTLKFEV